VTIATVRHGTRRCPACGGPATQSPRTARGKKAIGGGPLEIVACACGAAFQPRVPTEEELARWYDYMGHNPLNMQTTPLLDRRLGRMVDGFEPVRLTSRLVEIGIGGGLFVRTATTRGWDVWGTEISPSCVAALRPIMGERLHEGTVETIPFPDGSFDGAAMIEVIEHFDDPLPYLKAAHRLLRPGGRLFVTTPNARGMAGRVLGTQWRAYTDEHLSYFEPRSVTALLARAGFVDIEIDTTNFDLLAITVQLRDRLPRRHRRSPTPAPSSAASPPTPPKRTERLGWAASAFDTAIELTNRVARFTRLGDTLKVAARRP